MIRLSFVLVSIALLMTSSEAGAQASPCLPSDSVITLLQQELTNLVTATDTAVARVRNSVNLPALSAADVQFVTDTIVCASAAQQLAAITPGGDASPAAWVFRMGPTRYVAFNFRQKIHGNGFLFVFDSSFTKLASFPM